MIIVVMRISPVTYQPEIYGLLGPSVFYMIMQMIYGKHRNGIVDGTKIKESRQVRLTRLQQKVKDYYDKPRMFLTPKEREFLNCQ